MQRRERQEASCCALIERGCPREFQEIPICVDSSAVNRVDSNRTESSCETRQLSTPVHFCSPLWSSTHYEYFPRDFFLSFASEILSFGSCTRIEELMKERRSRDLWIHRTTWNSRACWGPGRLELDSFSAASAPL